MVPYAQIATSTIADVTTHIATHQRNIALKRAARVSFKRIGEFITQSRVDRLLQTDQLARAAQVEVGTAMNVAPEGQSAVETIASRIVAGAAGDQFAIDEDLRRRELVARAQMEDVQASTNSQMVNPILAGAQAGLAAWGANAPLTEMQGQQAQVQVQSQAQDQSYLQNLSVNDAQRKEFLAQLDESAARASYYRSTLGEYQNRIGPLSQSPYVNVAGQQIFSPMWTPQSF